MICGVRPAGRRCCGAVEGQRARLSGRTEVGARHRDAGVDSRGRRIHARDARRHRVRRHHARVGRLIELSLDIEPHFHVRVAGPDGHRVSGSHRQAIGCLHDDRRGGGARNVYAVTVVVSASAPVASQSEVVTGKLRPSDALGNTVPSRRLLHPDREGHRRAAGMTPPRFGTPPCVSNVRIVRRAPVVLEVGGPR